METLSAQVEALKVAKLDELGGRVTLHDSHAAIRDATKCAFLSGTWRARVGVDTKVGCRAALPPLSLSSSARYDNMSRTQGKKKKA